MYIYSILCDTDFTEVHIAVPMLDCYRLTLRHAALFNLRTARLEAAT